MMSDGNGDLYGLGSITNFVGFDEEEEEEERDRARMAAYGTEPGVYGPGGLSPSAISDAVSIIAGDGHRRGSASLASAGVRERIASHPLFPKLLGAYLDCRKVGAPPEIATDLEEIRRDNGGPSGRTMNNAVTVTSDRALDDFMETYCDILTKYKSDLSRPFDEATSFLSEMQTQLNDLISNPSGSSTSYVSDYEAQGNSSEEEYLNDEKAAGCYEERELKEKLLRKYSGYITNLKLEFSKKKKTGKLPKDATKILHDWWALHSRWPYPTEGDKIALGELTGLDQKQINNWFINQRKRHWKPPDNNMHVTLLDSHSLYGPLYHL